MLYLKSHSTVETIWSIVLCAGRKKRIQRDRKNGNERSETCFVVWFLQRINGQEIFVVFVYNSLLRL